MVNPNSFCRMLITFEEFSLVWSGHCHGISDQSISVLFLRRKRRRRTDIESTTKTPDGIFRRESNVCLENLCSTQMDIGLHDFSRHSNLARVKIKMLRFLNEMCRSLCSVFIPQIVKLPSDNSTSNWEEMKYLFNHFDSSSMISVYC